jgi:hypothetical protein
MTFMLRKLDDVYFIKFDVVKKHDRVQVRLHAFLPPLTGVGEWPASRLAWIILRKMATRIFVGSDNFLPMLGIEPHFPTHSQSPHFISCTKCTKQNKLTKAQNKSVYSVKQEANS